MTVKPIIIGSLGKVTKGLKKGIADLEIKGRVETSKQQLHYDRPEY